MIETLFILAAGLNAFLLFSLQPLIAKAILPLFGGSPSVWSTCLVFFQLTLLLGYLFAHFISTRVTFHRRLLLVPGILIFITSIIGGIEISETESISSQIGTAPISSLLVLLAGACALHAIILSSGAPTQQSAFARAVPGKNPYRLYAASNYGSLIGLLSYPLCIEPNLALADQISIWKFLYGVLGIILTVLSFLNSPEITKSAATNGKVGYHPLWFLLPGLSSALLISITSFVSTDVAPVPLLWVIPFAIFLITYAVAFQGNSEGSSTSIHVLTRVTTLGLILCWLAGAREPWLLVIPLFFASFTLLCFCLHKNLYAIKPANEHLTRFYIAVSLGGCLGGSFASFIAPFLFFEIRELPILLVVALYFTSLNASTYPTLRSILLVLLGIALTTLGYFVFNHHDNVSKVLLWIPVISFAYLANRTTRGLALHLGVVVLSGFLIQDYFTQPLYRARNFFGTLNVHEGRDGMRSLVHGLTVHGSQARDRMDYCEPTAYYHPGGPSGKVLSHSANFTNVGIIGLGTGALACYGTPSQNFTFFEINPQVAEVAQDRFLFTFLKNAQVNRKIILGDARLKLREIQDQSFELLVIDAFSSDAIPVHLLTVEAFREYLRVIAQDGALLIHISNKFLDLTPVIAGMADEFDLTSVRWIDAEEEPVSIAEGKLASYWVLLSRSPETIKAISSNGKWERISTSRLLTWTDQYSSISQIFNPLRF